jgi:hypothetical protein
VSLLPFFRFPEKGMERREAPRALRYGALLGGD